MSVACPTRNGRRFMAGIYKITSPKGKVYIGQSWDILTRWRSYKAPASLHSQPKLAASLRKYGAASHKFEIVVWFSTTCTQDALDEYECLEISAARAANRGNKRPDFAEFNRRRFAQMRENKCPS